MFNRVLVGLLALSFLISGGLVSGSLAGDGPLDMRLIEDFSRCKDGTFPEGWICHGGEGSKVYIVRSHPERYLEANAIGSAVTIAKKFQYDLREYPLLAWEWRVLELPEGGDERYKETGDSAASIYVVFPGLFRPDNIKYVWSSSLPVGTTTQSPYNSNTKIVVLRNQCSSLGTWFSEEVNVYEDYKRLFGHEPGPVQAIAIMSDSDNTGSRASAHYKKITIKKNKRALGAHKYPDLIKRSQAVWP